MAASPGTAQFFESTLGNPLSASVTVPVGCTHLLIWSPSTSPVGNSGFVGTFDGVPLPAATYDDGSGPSFAIVAAWLIVAPAPGSRTLAITHDDIGDFKISVQTLPILGSASFSASALVNEEDWFDPITQSIVSAVNDLVVGLGNIGGSNVTIMSPSTQQHQDVTDFGTAFIGTRPGVGGSTAVAWTIDSPQANFNYGVINFVADAGGAGGGGESYAPSTPRFPRRMARLRG